MGARGALETIEPLVIAFLQWVRLGVEVIGALVVGIGVILAIYQFILHFRDPQGHNFNHIRLTLGKHLALALEFQVGADVLTTAIAPTWEQIGKLAAVAAIRTALNYFLTREIELERRREKKMADQNDDSLNVVPS